MTGLPVLVEVSILIVGLYYLSFIIWNYWSIKKKPKKFKLLKKKFIYSFFGAIGIVLSFQVYFYTSFYEKHPVIEVIIKIILGGFSIVNQLLIDDIEKYQDKLKRKKKSDDFDIFQTKTDRNWKFKLINRLYLLNIVFKPLYRRSITKM